MDYMDGLQILGVCESDISLCNYSKNKSTVHGLLLLLIILISFRLQGGVHTETNK